jgi:ankyrin repeat protein
LFLASIPSNQLPATTTDTDDAVMNKLANSIESIFLNNDYDAFFRVCRSFLKNSPELIHTAIDNNYMDLLLKFIPTSLNVILQQKNSLGETVLLHALRLNRLEIIQAILKKDKSDVLLEAIDEKDNNIFHIIALYSIPLETINFLINHLVKNSINISKKFDRFNQDHCTPLQLSISKNNLLATKSFLKYFQTNIHQNLTGDNLLHLAVRCGNLSMVQYLIENGQLINQVKQSNLQMTPKDLAQSLKHHDMVEYFNEIFPPQEIDENDSSDDDDD